MLFSFIICAANMQNVNEIGTSDVVSSDGVYKSNSIETNKSAGLDNNTSHATNDGVVVNSQISHRIPLESGLLRNVDSGIVNEISTFLSKPQMIAYGTLASTDTVSSPVYTTVFPSALITSNNVWKNKVDGIYAFRGDTVFTLQVNANRFQQGRYIMAWIPYCGAEPSKSAALALARRFTLVQITQLPHVEIDITCDTEATLTVPMVTPQGYTSLYNTSSQKYGENGELIIVPYSPLVSVAGSSTATFTLFAHFENVDVKMPVNPQANRAIKSKIKRRISPIKEEQEANDIGPITSTLSKISVASGMLKDVPLLSTIAAPVSWASNIAAGVASVFGWSKPHNSSVVGTMVRYIAPKYSNADTADPSVKLGYLESNELEILPGFAGTDIDEMSLKYVSSISAWFTTLSWTTSDAENTRIDSWLLSPMRFQTQTSVGANTVYNVTPVAYVAGFFGLYRGSLKFTFKMVKTEFHSGRLALLFAPIELNSTTSFTTPTIATSSYVHREIIDIRNGNEFTFVVPYVSFSPYRSTKGSDSYYGVLAVEVLNPLVAPATVSSTVNILVEVSAADDMEFAEPKEPLFSVTTAIPQSGESICRIVSDNLGNSKIYYDDAPSRYCIGEKVQSFNTLLKRFSNIAYRDSQSGLYAPFIDYLPFGLPINSTTNVGIDRANTKPDLFGLIAPCYGLYRGGVRFKTLSLDASTPSNFVAGSRTFLGTELPSSVVFQSSTDYGGYTDIVGVNFPSQIFHTAANGGVEVEYPFYSRFPSVAVNDLIVNSDGGTALNKYTMKYTAPRVYGFTWTNYSSSSSPAREPINTPKNLRAMADDAQLGLFICVPPLLDFPTSF